MKLTFLGSGTSHGVPVIGCNCKVCTSTDPKDNRYRASVLVEHNGTVILIDVGPDFRTQALRKKLTKIDVVLVTHGHADHLNGLDDLRIFSNSKIIHSHQGMEALKIYTNEKCLLDIKTRFSYIFKNTQEGGGKPLFTLINTDDFSAKKPIVVGNKSDSLIYCTPIPLMHGNLPTSGFLLKTDNSANGGIAYITDCDFISDESIALLQGLDCLIIDGLRVRDHSTHFCFADAIEVSAKIAAPKTYFTHICHDNTHSEIIAILNELKAQFPSLCNKTVEPAYDGLIIED